jgi:hypothetical protein
MDDAFNWLYSRVPAALRFAVGWLIDLAKAVYNQIVTYLRLIGVPFFRIWNAVAALRNTLFGVISAIGNKLYLLVRIIVPNGIRWARDQAISWALNAIAAARTLLINTINTLRRWAESAVNILRNAVNSLTRWVSDWISKIWTLLTWAANIVSKLLTDPKKLVEWIIAPLVMRILRYIWENGSRIFGWLLRSSPTFTRWLAVQLEQIITRAF